MRIPQDHVGDLYTRLCHDYLPVVTSFLLYPGGAPCVASVAKAAGARLQPMVRGNGGGNRRCKMRCGTARRVVAELRMVLDKGGIEQATAEFSSL